MRTLQSAIGITWAVFWIYFYYAASVEERNLTATFPTKYPAYRLSTKMLIPFVLQVAATRRAQSAEQVAHLGPDRRGIV